MTLAARYNQLLRELEVDPNRMSEAAYVNYELCFHRLAPEMRLLQDKIQRVLGEVDHLPVRVAANLLRGIALINDLNYLQKAIRSKVLQFVRASLESIDTSDLVAVASHINRMETFNMNAEESRVVKAVFDTVIARIDELEEHDIRMLISSDSIPFENMGAYRLREKVFQRVLAMIDEKGRSRLPQ